MTPTKHEDGTLPDLWNKYFGTKFSGNITTCVNCSLPSQSQYFLYLCLFYNLSNCGIYISSSNYDFFETDSTFYNCYSPDTGGGMYVYGSNSAINRRFCGDLCKGLTGSKGAQFLYSQAAYNNSFIEGTVFNCPPNYGGNTIRLTGGNQIIYSVNDSYNQANWDSCFYIESGISIVVNFSSFGYNRNYEVNEMIESQI